MSGTGVLVDSVVFIDHFNGIQAATDYLGSVRDVARITPISVAEVLVGLAGEPARRARLFLACFPLLPLDREVAELAARLRREHGWRLPDAFQAAAARHHGLALATRNTRDFPPDRHAFVRVPYRLG